MRPSILRVALAIEPSAWAAEAPSRTLSKLLKAIRDTSSMGLGRREEDRPSSARLDFSPDPLLLTQMIPVSIAKSFGERAQEQRWILAESDKDRPEFDSPEYVLGQADILVAISDLNVSRQSPEVRQEGEAASIIYLALKYDIQVLLIDSAGSELLLEIAPDVFKSLLASPPGGGLQVIRLLGAPRTQDWLQNYHRKWLKARTALDGLEREISVPPNSYPIASRIAKVWDYAFVRSFEPAREDVARQEGVLSAAVERMHRSRSPLMSLLRIDVRAVVDMTRIVFANRRKARLSEKASRNRQARPSDDQQPLADAPSPAQLVVRAFKDKRKGKNSDISGHATHLQGLHRFSFLATTALILGVAVLPKIGAIVKPEASASRATEGTAGSVQTDGGRYASEDQGSLQIEVVHSTQASAVTEVDGQRQAVSESLNTLDQGSAQANLDAVSLAHEGSQLAEVAAYLDRVGAWMGLVCIVVAMAIYYLARMRKWQERATDLRVVSERLRHAPIMVITGISPFDLSEQPPHYAEHNPEKTWIGIAYRRLVLEVLRANGVRDARAKLNSQGGIENHWPDVRGEVDEWLGEQIGWLERTALSYKSAMLLLENLARAFVALAVVALLLALAFGSPILDMVATVSIMTCLSISLVLAQAEIGRLASRYGALAAVLRSNQVRVRALRLNNEANRVALRSLTESSLRAALAEAFEWRLLHRFHPIHSPV